MTEQQAVHLRAILASVDAARKGVGTMVAVLRPEPAAVRAAINGLADERRRQLPRGQAVSQDELSLTASDEYGRRLLADVTAAYRHAREMITAAHAMRDDQWHRLRHPVVSAPVVPAYGDPVPARLELLYQEARVARFDRDFTGRPLPELLTALDQADAADDPVQAGWLTARLERELATPVVATNVDDQRRREAERSQIRRRARCRPRPARPRRGAGTGGGVWME